ncbi:hypothetical protein SNOUR_38250 [Streptomyces noursei ATCC 11455]|nr:hypothetical protein SNOUR_38250 [Streptomyces noursei ATCC 11455]
MRRTRRGSGVVHPSVERVAALGADVGRRTELVEGADALIDCAIPAYDRWVTCRWRRCRPRARRAPAPAVNLPVRELT